MTAATWIAIAVLGPGSLAVFVWFLLDVRQLLNGDTGPDPDEDRGRG